MVYNWLSIFRFPLKMVIFCQRITNFQLHQWTFWPNVDIRSCHGLNIAHWDFIQRFLTLAFGDIRKRSLLNQVHQLAIKNVNFFHKISKSKQKSAIYLPFLLTVNLFFINCPFFYLLKSQFWETDQVLIVNHFLKKLPSKILDRILSMQLWPSFFSPLILCCRHSDGVCKFLQLVVYSTSSKNFYLCASISLSRLDYVIVCWELRL